MESPADATPDSAAKRLAHLLDLIVGLVFCAVVALNFASAALRYLAKRAILGADEVQISDGAGVPMWIPHSAVLVGFSAMTLIFARALVIGLRWRTVAAPTPSHSNP